MTTEENLRAAFAGESQANRRYLAFAKKAEEEGLPQVAKLFRAVAEAETVHAHRHLSVLGEVKSTKENLQAAIDGENYKSTKMYPEFISQAKTDGNNEAVQSFSHANVVKKFTNSFTAKRSRSFRQAKKLKKRITMFVRYVAIRQRVKRPLSVLYAVRPVRSLNRLFEV